MPSKKRQGRDLRTHRKVEIQTGFHRLAEGSVLYRCEGTVVLVTASVDDSVPRFLEGSGKGWLTADYQMHPRANPQRRERRDGRNGQLSGRTREIERLIGRSMRCAVELERLGERTIQIDCDVLEADGGTRTASVTAAWIAVALAANKMFANGTLERPFIRDQVASISVGHVDGELALDLCYAEDSTARVDLNLVATEKGAIVEVQGTAEGQAVPREDVNSMIDLGLEGVQSLCKLQLRALEDAGVKLDRIMKGANA